MDKSISFFDGGAEGFYHGLMLGLIALMDNQYKIKSNRESGDGRFDVCLIPREKRYPGIILELKWTAKLSESELDKWANEALEQIDKLRYDSEMKEDGITDILKFGIAFSGKKVKIADVIMEEDELMTETKLLNGIETVYFTKNELLKSFRMLLSAVHNEEGEGV